MVKWCLVLFVVSWSALASLKDLGKELLENNSSVKSQEFDTDIQKLNLEKFLGTTDWSLAFASKFRDSNLVGTTFNTKRTLVKENTLTLSSASQFGVDLSLAAGISYYDYTRGGSFFASLPEKKFYEFSTTASLAIDLWKDFGGQNFRGQKKANEASFKLAKVQLNQKIASELLSLSQNYLNYYTAKMASLLSESSYQRAQKRYRNTKKRFRDGASPRIDLYQAETSALNQKEIKIAAKMEEISSKENLDSLIHRKVTEFNLKKFNFKNLELSRRYRGSLAKNYDLQALKLALTRAQKQMDVAKMSDGLDINLLLQYKSNAVDRHSKEAISDGFFSGDRDEKIVSLNVVIPLEDNVQGSMAQQSKVELLKNKYNLKAKRKNLELAFQNLEQMVKLLEQQYQNAKLKVQASQKALREASRLYNVGKRDIEFVLNTEDALINAERSLITIYANYEKLVATEAYMSGNINSYINGYRY